MSFTNVLRSEWNESPPYAIKLITRKKYESIFSSIEFHERSEWNESLQMIAEGVSEGLFHIPEDVSPSTSLQHLML